MHIDVFFTAESVKNNSRYENVVVIDVLRATSTMINATLNGCKEIVIAENRDGAMAIREKIKDRKPLLCGEENGHKISGFDFGNSPEEYSNNRVKNRTLIFKTTNGTKTILKAINVGKKILIGALMNASAVAECLCKSEGDAIILCAGTEGERSMEDVLCAGMIAEKIMRCPKPVLLSRKARNCVKTYLLKKKYMEKTIKQSFHGKQLIEIGFEKDIDFCIRQDVTGIVPKAIFKDGAAVVRKA